MSVFLSDPEIWTGNFLAKGFWLFSLLSSIFAANEILNPKQETSRFLQSDQVPVLSSLFLSLVSSVESISFVSATQEVQS